MMGSWQNWWTFVGGKITKDEPTVTKYLGSTLLPHSSVSLVLTEIAVNTFNSFAPKLAFSIYGSIVATAIIKGIIVVIEAKFAFKLTKEILNKKEKVKEIEQTNN